MVDARVAAFDDFKEHHGDKATMANLKALGKYRMEGKQYLVKDGDIIEFKFNVSK
jgi:ribosome-binding ATPase YchF (GTP1/OBG family)